MNVWSVCIVSVPSNQSRVESRLAAAVLTPYTNGSHLSGGNQNTNDWTVLEKISALSISWIHQVTRTTALQNYKGYWWLWREAQFMPADTIGISHSSVDFQMQEPLCVNRVADCGSYIPTGISRRTPSVTRLGCCFCMDNCRMHREKAASTSPSQRYSSLIRLLGWGRN